MDVLFMSNWLRGVAVAMKRKVAKSNSVRPVNVCPLDGLPCEYVSSCDEVLAWRFGVVLGEAPSCSRAVFKVGKK